MNNWIVGYVSVSAFLTLSYVFLMGKYWVFWKKMPILTDSSREVSTTVSVLIAARNEENMIVDCLKSILNNNFPPHLLEIIVIDDHSEDQTAARVLAFIDQNSAKMPPPQYPPTIRLIRNAKTGKKAAIETAIAQSEAQLIVTTDADCLVPTDWLYLIVQTFEAKKPLFIAAPVSFYEEKTNFERFQSLDFLGMMGITAAGIEGGFLHMCNGANLAYPRAIFEKMNGFEGISDKASGDDMLLMQKITRQFPDRVAYLKTPRALVRTHAKPDWASFVAQRVRWASKSGDYPQVYVTVQLGLIFLFCVSVFISLIISILNSFFLNIFFVQLFIKFVVDYIFLREISLFFGRKDLMNLKNFGFNEFWHLTYIVVVGTLANVQKTYEWKGRRVR